MVHEVVVMEAVVSKEATVTDQGMASATIEEMMVFDKRKKTASQQLYHRKPVRRMEPCRLSVPVEAETQDLSAFSHRQR